MSKNPFAIVATLGLLVWGLAIENAHAKDKPELETLVVVRVNPTDGAMVVIVLGATDVATVKEVEDQHHLPSVVVKPIKPGKVDAWKILHVSGKFPKGMPEAIAQIVNDFFWENFPHGVDAGGRPIGPPT